MDTERLTQLVILGDVAAYDAYRRELERRGMWWCEVPPAIEGTDPWAWAQRHLEEWQWRNTIWKAHDQWTGPEPCDRDGRDIIPGGQSCGVGRGVSILITPTRYASLDVAILHDGERLVRVVHHDDLDYSPPLDSINTRCQRAAGYPLWRHVVACGSCAFLRGDSHLLSARWGRPLGWNVLTPCASSAPPPPHTP